MNKVMLLMVGAALTACGPSQPSETVDALAANPDRIKEIQRQCKEEALCRFQWKLTSQQT